MQISDLFNSGEIDELTSCLQSAKPFYRKGTFTTPVVTIDELESLLNMGCHSGLEIVQDGIKINRDYYYEVYWWGSPTKNMNKDSVQKYWDEGATLVLISASQINRDLSSFCGSVEKLFDAKCDAHFYMGKKGSRSFPPHADRVDNLIIQLYGKTRWKLYGFRDPAGYTDEDVVFETEMHPGDMLLVNDRRAHQAEPMTDRISVSIPLQFHQPGEPAAVNRSVVKLELGEG